MSFFPIERFQDDSALGSGHLELINNPAVDGSQGTTGLCATSLVRGLEAKVKEEMGWALM